MKSRWHPVILLLQILAAIFLVQFTTNIIGAIPGIVSPLSSRGASVAIAQPRDAFGGFVRHHFDGLGGYGVSYASHYSSGPPFGFGLLIHAFIIDIHAV